MEENLRSRKTVNHIVKKLAPLAHAFKYATRLLPCNRDHEEAVRHTRAITPHIYALPIWGSAKEEAYLRPLILLQKRSYRTCRSGRTLSQ